MVNREQPAWGRNIIRLPESEKVVKARNRRKIWAERSAAYTSWIAIVFSACAIIISASVAVWK